ncbi:MAG: winged helix-turn-helix domain-containing protein [Acetobacteraceae bacterium]
MAIPERRAEEALRTVSFGPFRLFPAQQLLREGERQVILGSRALEILIALAQRPGDLVTKEELIARAWPDTFVDESNLRVHIAGLRRALRDGEDGARYIATVPGRGYRFVAPLGPTDTPPPPVRTSPPIRRSTLPGLLTRVIGRETIVATLCEQLPQRRFVTLVGPGGIGKTTVAVAVARELAAAYPDGVVFLDLAPVSDPALMPSALATALGLSIASDNRVPGLVAHLRERQTLLLLDSCEHVVEAAAALTEAIHAGAPGAHILATSREPLRAAGERVHRLAPLESPSGSQRLTAGEALAFPGVQLFVERAAASGGGFHLADADAPFVADICRRLDGIALAIELAAGRVDAFGVRDLAARLDDRLRLLTGGRRTALPRHQTLGAMLDWSYRLLPDGEQRLLRKLAVFAGDFSLEAALAVAGDDAPRTVELIAILVAKSLIAAEFHGDIAQYRLLDSTRLYCGEKLREAHELAEVSRRHAEYYRAVLATAEAEHETRPAGEWLAAYSRHIDNLRSALHWAFGTDGDRALGIALATVAVPLWVQLSLMGECRIWSERALACLDSDDPAAAPARMQLSASLGWSLMFAVGAARATRVAWTEALQRAERLDDTDYRLRALWGLWVDRLNNGQLDAALDLAQQFAAIVAGSPNPIDLMIADRIMGTSLHFLGDQRRARHHIESMLERYAAAADQRLGARFQFDQQVTAHYFQARILWLLGFADQAARLVEANIQEARPIGNALSLGSVLGQGACPIALLRGDLDAAERYGAMLLDHAGGHALRIWQGWARCFNAVVAVRRGDVASGLRALRHEVDAAGEALLLPRYLFLLGELSACLGEAGEAPLGLRTVEGAITRCEASGERWYMPELWRIKGDLVARGGTGETVVSAAAACLRRAIDLARVQHARGWELRAAVGLARLRDDAASRAELRDVVDAFTEGFTTADLRAARQVLDAGS